MLTPSATTIKLYLLMQVSIAQQGGDPYVLQTNSHLQRKLIIYTKQPDFMWRVQKIISRWVSIEI